MPILPQPARSIFGDEAFRRGLPIKIFIVKYISRSRAGSKREEGAPGLSGSGGPEIETKSRYIAAPTLARQESKEESLKRASASQSAYLNALASHDRRIKQCRGDGNCLFRTLSHQIYGTEAQHGLIRQRICDYMEADSHHFQNIAEADQSTGSQADGFARYIATMRQPGVSSSPIPSCSG